MSRGYAFGYCRLSIDAKGLAENVEDQEAWFREYAARHWPRVPVRVYSDNDKSAAKDDVRRPDFEAMNEAIARGECAYLWSVEQTRLERRLIPWLQYVELAEETGQQATDLRCVGVATYRLGPEARLEHGALKG